MSDIQISFENKAGMLNLDLTKDWYSIVFFERSFIFAVIFEFRSALAAGSVSSTN